MTTKKHFLTFLTLFGFGFLFWASTSSKNATAPETKKTFTFSYTPPNSAKPGSAGMVLALIQPNYTPSFTSSNTELFERFKEAISADLQQIIISKGFTLKGPYQSFDEMVYGDKKTVDLAIIIEIVPSFASTQGGWSLHMSLLGPAYNSYSYQGQVSLVGKINMSGIEPMTGQKVWEKSVEIPNIENIQISTSQQYTAPLQGDQIYTDPGIYNAIGNALSQQYDGIMSQVDKYFEIEDIASSSNKEVIKELKAKKVF